MTATITGTTIQAYKKPDLIAVLLSGGIDSTTSLYMAAQEAASHSATLHAISMDYGQRHSKELEYASRSCAALDIEQHIIDLSNVIPSTMLTNDAIQVPDIGYGDIEGVSPTYVPYRNGLMLSAATAHLVGLLDKVEPTTQAPTVGHLYCGIHADDAAGFAYPDCTPEWFGSQANAIFTGTYGRVRLIAPLLWMNKTQIIMAGDDFGVPWEDTWSCYKGEELHCGTCPTCKARREGFFDAEVTDPTSYANAT
jgi:7-cyano-7-deazaguanine synthase